MTITAHKKIWNSAMIVLVVYMALAFALAFLLPAELIKSISVSAQIPISEAIAAYSSEPLRVKAFWFWMLTTFPLFLVAFSVAAPVKLKAQIDGKRSALVILAVSFIFFGLITTPIVISFLFFTTNIESNQSKLSRLAMGMSDSNWSLFYGGSMIVIGLLVLAWMSYVAIPRAFFMISKK